MAAEENNESTRYLVTSQRAVGTFFGISLPTVRDWLGRGMPHEHSQYDLGQIARWRLKRAREQPGRNGQLPMSPVDVERHRKLKLANDRFEDRLVDKAEAQLEMTELLSWMKAQLMSVPERIVTDLPRKSRPVAKRTTSHQIRLILKKLSCGLPLLDGEPPLYESDDND